MIQLHVRLGLPIRVDNRATIAAHIGEVPLPRLRVDRLADRTQHLKSRDVMLLGGLVSMPAALST